MDKHSSAGHADTYAADDAPATSADTRLALLNRSHRQDTPLPNCFVQNPDRKLQDRTAPLATFIRNKDLRALQAYLLITAVTSSDAGGEGWSTTLPLTVWARAFGTTDTARPQAASTAASKILGRLQSRRLIMKQRSGTSRGVRVTLLSADGSGEAYRRPTSHFLKLPHAYWLDEWHQKLDLPATAMLLVFLHERPGCELPTEHMRRWYGFSPDTAERGIKILRDHKLLIVDQRLKKAPLAPTGITRVNRYFLRPPFGTPPPRPKVTSIQDPTVQGAS
ncbi:hypothetical protein AYJ66_04355 [Dietzia cinnamea]|nr:hypothetical protein AYJ66_04355 [Dietzia cinnamea]